MFRQTGYDDSEESDVEGSWGISEEQSAKQKREFRIRFGQSEESKETFGDVTPKQLGLWLRGIWEGQPRTIKVVDVRDDDFNLHGHIKGAVHRPNDEFSPQQIIRELEMVDVVVFICYRCSSRGPMCAREYIRIQKKELREQEVYVLVGGMEAFLREAKNDTQLDSLVVYAKKWVPTLGRLRSFSEQDQKHDFSFLENDQVLASNDYWQCSNFFSPTDDRPYSPLDESPRYKII